MWHKFPLVLGGNNALLGGVPTVSIDQENATYDAVMHLIQTGCRRICLVCTPAFEFNGEQIYLADDFLRAAGYKRALEDAGIEFDPRMILSGYDLILGSEVYSKAMAVLKSDLKPDAFICNHDFVALQCTNAIYDCGYSVPENISVMSFEITDMCRFFRPKISSVEYPWYDIGVNAVNELAHLRGNDLNFSDAPILLPYKIVDRETTRTPE